MPVAFTRIKHGKDDGSVVEIEEGEEVKGLPADVVKDLKEQGLVGEESVASEKLMDDKAKLEAKVAELELKLAEARGDQPAAVAPPTPEGKSTPTGPSKPASK